MLSVCDTRDNAVTHVTVCVTPNTLQLENIVITFLRYLHGFWIYCNVTWPRFTLRAHFSLSLSPFPYVTRYVTGQ